MRSRPLHKWGYNPTSSILVIPAGPRVRATPWCGPGSRPGRERRMEQVVTGGLSLPNWESTSCGDNCGFYYIMLWYAASSDGNNGG